RLHQRVPGREVLSRREALHDRRRDERDPADGHRPQPAGAVSDLQSLAGAILAGRYRALARAISMIERDAPEIDRLLASLYPATEQKGGTTVSIFSTRPASTSSSSKRSASDRMKSK